MRKNGAAQINHPFSFRLVDSFQSPSPPHDDLTMTSLSGGTFVLLLWLLLGSVKAMGCVGLPPFLLLGAVWFLSWTSKAGSRFYIRV
jgi:hypothetical protein